MTEVDCRRDGVIRSVGDRAWILVLVVQALSLGQL